MIVRTIRELESQGRVVSISHGKSTAVRLLTKADGLNFSISEARAQKAGQADLWYKHHWEANHIIFGTGEVTDLTTGQSWRLEPGVGYNVGPKDRHRVRAHTDIHLISVFCPPLAGHELHDADGALAPSGPVPPGPEGY